MKTLELSGLTVGVARDTADDFPPHGLDAALCPRVAQGELRYEDEISGHGKIALALADLSAACDYPVLFGIDTRLRQTLMRSVLTFCRGQLADIADRVRSVPSGGYIGGNDLHLLRLRRATVGLLVDSDVLLPSLWQKLLPQAAAVFSLARGAADADYARVADISARCGTPYVVSFEDGDLLWGTPPARKARR